MLNPQSEDFGSTSDPWGQGDPLENVSNTELQSQQQQILDGECFTVISCQIFFSLVINSFLPSSLLPFFELRCADSKVDPML